MFRPLTPSHRRAPRRGTVVVITIFALITILMVLGLAFMMYAVKEKAVAQAYKDAANVPGTGAPDPTNTINRFLGTLVYDENDDGDSLNNALRGLSIARAMYGGRRDTSAPWAGSTVPWAGVGTFHGTTTFGDRASQVNHTLVMMGATPYLIDPEWTGSRSFTGGAVDAFLASQTGRSYVGRHAGYTYPDLKNFFLGARDPATGEVLVPSFYRDWLFRHASQPAGQSGLHPDNPNWGTKTSVGLPEADAQLRILRPRPAEHPNFPRVPPNADGTITGDVQNLPGALGVQRNDSLWMDIGMKPHTLADGRIVKPLVAALILAADGLFDLSMHGNQLAKALTTPPALWHVSHGGYAPWEINLGYAVSSYGAVPSPLLSPAQENERRALMQYRAPIPANRQAAFDPFTSGRLMPTYSSVAWTATPVTFTLPTLGNLRGVPSSGDATFAGMPYGNFQNDNAAVASHPAAYNPNEFPTITSTITDTPIYPFTDIKRLSLRYTFSPDWYFQAFATKSAQGTFLGDPTTYPYDPAPAANWNAAFPKKGTHRLDPAHSVRNLVSPRNGSLDRPAISPNFSRLLNEALQIPTTPPGATKPISLFTTTTLPPYPGPGSRGPSTDFAADNQWVNAYAALGSVNLNRPLADYRNNLSAPISAGNLGNLTQAEGDRQQFARDIFARLVAALGAAATVDTTTGNVTIAEAPGTPQYNALRYLAQVAVNLVDYIDNDDVSTVFVWNPSGNPTTDMSEAGNRVVFGVEKPRLIINEAYGEITNDPMDPATDTVPLANTKKAHVRFLAELLNPTATPHANATGIFGDGSVPLNAYQIQISRANRTFGPTGMLMAPEVGNTSSYLTNNPVHPKYLENTMGVFDPATGAPDATCRLSSLTPPPPSVGPNNAAYAPMAANLLTNGIALLRTDPGGTVKAPSEFNADPAAPGSIWATSITCPAPDKPNSLGYVIQMPANVSDLSKPEFKQHVVLLQRLVNPYLAFDTVTNPYITVDMMDYVPAFDAVTRGAGQKDPRNPRPAAGANGSEYDPPAERFSVGKVQPLAGQSFATVTDGPGKYNQYAFATSMVLNQTAAPNATDPRHSFGRHNGNSNTTQPAVSTVTNSTSAPATISDTIMTPFDWMPHMDRPLETLGDVFFARDSRPYRLTTEFAVNSTNRGLVYDSGYANWRLHESGMARALEFLTVKSPSYHVAHGGRVSGKINVNALQDRRVARGLLDPQPSNKFDVNFVDTKVWEQWMGSRTRIQQRLSADGVAANPYPYRVPVPNQRPDGTAVSSLTDSATGLDRPFLPFGAPAAATGPFAYVNTAGTEDTILRQAPPPYPTFPNQPLLYQTLDSMNPYTMNLYTQSEPFRKVVNNVTTVSHTFVVYLTIGYFDVTFPAAPKGWPTGVSPPAQFGAEVYDKIPGDMRQKYIAFVDMSNMALKPQFPYTGDPDPSSAQALEQPFFTTLTATARPAAGAVQISIAATSFDNVTNPANPVLYIASDGQRMPIVSGTQLVIGYGTEQQLVTVQSVDSLGQLTVTGLTRTAWGGTCVSNVRPGYAGPQPGFDYTLPKYRPVVPYVERLR